MAPRTRTGCLTCRKRKVKCDEGWPHCATCTRLGNNCTWGRPPETSALHEYVTYFLDNSSGLLIYPYDPGDVECNPFQKYLAPIASSSHALMHSMAAVAARHQSRIEKQPDLIQKHKVAALSHYEIAIHELSSDLSDSSTASSDPALASSLLLCVFDISYSKHNHWLIHLQGAKDLIVLRKVRNVPRYLIRFFSLLDVSGSLFSGGGTLISDSYWLDEGLLEDETRRPYYDTDNNFTSAFSQLMIHMANLSRLSSDLTNKADNKDSSLITRACQISFELRAWREKLKRRSLELLDQVKWWRYHNVPCLTISETMEREAFSRLKICHLGCFIYLHHIINPTDYKSLHINTAIKEILDTAGQTPEHEGLDIGLYFGLFMAGISIFADEAKESFIRKRMVSEPGSIFHAEHSLELLNVLWQKQHDCQKKLDWRDVQDEMGYQLFLLP